MVAKCRILHEQQPSECAQGVARRCNSRMEQGGRRGDKQLNARCLLYSRFEEAFQVLCLEFEEVLFLLHSLLLGQLGLSDSLLDALI